MTSRSPSAPLFPRLSLVVVALSPLPALVWLAGAEAGAQSGPVPAMAPPTVDRETEVEQDAMGRRLQVALRAHGGEIYGCYDQAQTAERKPIAGEVLVRLWVAPGGAVSRVDMLKDEVGSASLARCLLAAMRTWDVPALAGSDVQQVVFPLVFKPESAGEKGGAAAASPPPPEVAAPRYVVPLAEGKPGPIGRGTVEARVLVDPMTVGATQATLTQLVLRPTARLAPHAHPGVLEALYVVKGLARVRGALKGVVTTANAGDLIVIPPSGLHSIESAPLASLTLIQIFAPGGPEHAYRDPKDRSGTVAGAAAGAPSPRPTERPTDPPVVVRAGEPRSLPILGGKGSAALFLDALPVGQAAVDRLEADAGAEVPLHAHDASDEILYVLSGRASMEVGGEKHAVSPNDAIHIPAGVPHSLRVIEKLVALQCYAPGGPEQRFKKPPAPHPPQAPEGARP